MHLLKGRKVTWNLIFIKNLLPVKPCIFMSLCILPSKHFVPIFQQRQSVQDSHQFCLILLQASLLPLWVLRKRSAAEGLVPPPLLKALPFCFTIGTRGREKPDLAKAQGILRFWENKIVHCLQHRILTSSSCGFSYYVLFFLQKKMVLPSTSYHTGPDFITNPGMSIY